MLKFSDISVIIPTYNRAEDLKNKTLNALMPHLTKLKEIIVVDQSTNTETEEMIKKLKTKKIRYFHTDVKSLTHARNIGIERVKKTTKLISFLDDDVYIGSNYYAEILKVFNHKKNAIAVAGYQIHNPLTRNEKIASFIKKFFFIGRLEKGKARVLSAYGNTYPISLNKIINSEWLPGFNLNYLKSAIKDVKFDEKMSTYCLAEDLDFNYRMYKKFNNGLFITPFAEVKHLTSQVERLPNKKNIFMNQINHFYLNYKNFNSTFKEKIIFWWSVAGLIILKLFGLLTFKYSELTKARYFFSSLAYCLLNLGKIRSGGLEIPS